MFSQPTSIEFHLPDWLLAYAGNMQAISSLPERMALVIGAARENVKQKTGGPFAAAVFESTTGRLVSLGVNLVTSENLSTLHAEMVALTLAQRKLRTYDLGRSDLPAHELVTSTEPCSMCFGAVPWSGVKRVVTGARDEDARAIGFDEGPKPEDWKKALQERHIEVVTDVCREQAAQILKDYLRHGGHIYNSREGD